MSQGTHLCIGACLICLVMMPAWAARNEDKNIGWPGQTLSGLKCEGRGQQFGPFDYTNPLYTVAGNYSKHGTKLESPLRYVEKAHFTPVVENLVRGKTSTKPIGDIDYTLRAFPNHHRALYALVREYLRKIPTGMKKLNPKEYSPFLDGYAPPECYFHRASYFAPEDGMVRALFGLYLHRRRDLDGALRQYQSAEKLMAPYAELYYNLGLLHFDRGEYSEAQQYADKAYSMNYQLPGLRRKLERLESSN